LDRKELRYLDHKASGARKPIGSGQYGLVFRARYRGQEVAIKELKGESAELPGALDQFRKEAALLFKLSHPAIVRMYGASDDFDDDQDILPFLVTELLPLHVADALAANKLTPPVRMQIVKDVASALLYLHSSRPKRIEHRDLKPQNMMLTADYRVKLIDFGLSRETDATKITGANKGTWFYMVSGSVRLRLLSSHCFPLCRHRSCLGRAGTIGWTRMHMGSVPARS
jgi:serine/threonine protein kinase